MTSTKYVNNRVHSICYFLYEVDYTSYAKPSIKNTFIRITNDGFTQNLTYIFYYCSISSYSQYIATLHCTKTTCTYMYIIIYKYMFYLQPHRYLTIAIIIQRNKQIRHIIIFYYEFKRLVNAYCIYIYYVIRKYFTLNNDFTRHNVYPFTQFSPPLQTNKQKCTCGQSIANII